MKIEFESEFEKYTRDQLFGVNIFHNKLNKLLYYSKHMNFEL